MLFYQIIVPGFSHMLTYRLTVYRIYKWLQTVTEMQENSGLMSHVPKTRSHDTIYILEIQWSEGGGRGRGRKGGNGGGASRR